MGWNPFASETETVITVATQITRVIEDDALPNSVSSGTLKALFQDGDISNYMMEEIASSVGLRAERMYNYAEDNYAFGLPSGEVYSSTQGRQQVEEVIETLEGKQVSMEYSHFSGPNFLHIGWMQLVSVWGYNHETNELQTLSATRGRPCYLKDMVVVVPSSQASTLDSRILEAWGIAACAGYTPERTQNTGDIRALISASDLRVSTTATSPYLYVTATRKVGNAIVDEPFSMNIEGYSFTDGYFHAKYYVDGVAKFWMYKNDSGTYPTLDSVYVDQPAVAGSYFPFTYFRLGRASMLADKTTAAYKTSAKLARYLGMDFDTIAQAMDENPDADKIEQAMLMFGVPSVSTNAIECRYLFDYFDNMHSAMGGNTSATGAFIASQIADGLMESGAWGGIFGKFLRRNLGPRYATRIGDARFAMTFAHDGIYKRLRAGSIGVIGTYTSTFGTSQIVENTVDVDTGESLQGSRNITAHCYRHQISANLYEEVLVTGLKMTYNIWNGYTTSGTNTSDLLLIPIDKTVSEDYTIMEREELYSRSLHFVFNSLSITTYEVKWYQQSWFRTFTVIVAVVITIASYGADGGSAIATALGLTGTAGLIATIVVTLAIGALMPKVFRLFVKVLGQDVATVLAIAALIYGGYSVATEGIAGAPMASDMLMLSTGLQRAVLESKMGDLMDENSAFQKYIEEQTKTLEETNELLDKQYVLSPFTVFGEKPEDYFNRTVHYGNIGTLGITAISSYVDIALALPKIQDTLGEPING